MRVSGLWVGIVGLGALSIHMTNVVPAVGAVTPTGDTTVASSGFTTVVGNGGVGTLTIDAQSTLTNAGAQIGVGPSGQGTATVRDANTLWKINGNLYSGYFGQGSLNILAGGRVESTTGGMGYEAGSVGSATISGAGSTWSVGNLYVGMLGTGDLTISDGGLITAGALFAPLGRLHGNGTIEARGLISDIDLRFDNTHSTTQTFAFGSGGLLKLNVNGTGSLGAGMAGVGSLRIADGKVINSGSGYLGMYVGSDGTATVQGAGTTWESGGDVYVGVFGQGTLNVEAGARLSTARDLTIGDRAGSTGHAEVKGAGTTAAISGDLRLANEGDGSLIVKDGAHLTTRSALFGPNNTAASAVFSGAGTRVAMPLELTIANGGNASMTIENGAFVHSGRSYIASFTTGVGSVIVRGAGSTWETSDAANNILYVGYRGKGSLRIEDGGYVSALSGVIGERSTAVGKAVVTGPGSTWDVPEAMNVGSTAGGIGTLMVADHGVVRARGVNVWTAGSEVELVVSGDSMMLLGNASSAGFVRNRGAIAFYADALLEAGVYRPIQDIHNRPISWQDNGSYTGVGGTWDISNATFTVAAATSLVAGDTDSVQSEGRLLFTDSNSGERAGASFGQITGTVNFSATPTDAQNVGALSALLSASDEVLAAWDFTTDFSGSEVLLSFDVGEGAEGLAVWHFDNGSWTLYDPALLSYGANGIASFTVSAFSGYAVTGAVPEPGALALLLIGATSLACRRRR